MAPWKAECAAVRRLQRKIYFGLLEEVEDRLAQGLENGSFMEQVGAPTPFYVQILHTDSQVGQVLARQAEFGMSRELTGYLGGALFEAGSDTTATWLLSLVLAMVAFPEAQKKAQVRSICYSLQVFSNSRN